MVATTTRAAQSIAAVVSVVYGTRPKWPSAPRPTGHILTMPGAGDFVNSHSLIVNSISYVSRHGLLACSLVTVWWQRLTKPAHRRRRLHCGECAYGSLAGLGEVGLGLLGHMILTVFFYKNENLLKIS